MKLEKEQNNIIDLFAPPSEDELASRTLIREQQRIVELRQRFKELGLDSLNIGTRVTIVNRKRDFYKHVGRVSGFSLAAFDYRHPIQVTFLDTPTSCSVGMFSSYELKRI